MTSLGLGVAVEFAGGVSASNRSRSAYIRIAASVRPCSSGASVESDSAIA
ncbi:MAG: hypothetical protein WA484_08970 [Solirubrobacteraceae bacterium]